MIKRRLHIHSDCYYWGGSENMVGIFLQSPMLNDEFDVTFSYRWTKEYAQGMKQWVTDERCVRMLGWRWLLDEWSYKWKGLAPLRVLTFPFRAWYFARLLARCNYQPDVVHINNGGFPGANTCNSMAIGARIAKYLYTGWPGIRKVTYTINSTARNPWWHRPITGLVRNSVDTFVTASDMLRTQCEEFLATGDDGEAGYIQNNWEVIPNTVKERPVMAPEEVRRRVGVLTDEDVLVVGVGANEPRKGWMTLLAAASGIRDQCLYISCMGADKTVDDYSLVNACDVLVLPSLRDEDFPNVVLMALMYGKPVVATDVGGVAEMFDDHEAGLLVEPGDIRGLRAALEFAVSNAEWRIEAGRIARRRFEERYAPEKVLERYIRMWRS